ncbi:MAG: glycosyltransferase family 39 protein [Gemmatimonadota bacterium]|nr:MAG: glycosyltransferase family 39 protein [Gemmatimonadota bacterium]
MTKKADGNNKTRINVQLLIFMFLVSLYLLFTPGYPPTSMGVSALLTALSLVDEGNFSIEEPTLETGIGKDGKYYTYEGLAFVLVVSFFTALSKVFGMFPSGVLFVNPILTAIACIILFHLGRELKYTMKTSVALALVYGIGTMAWVHARYLMPEPLTTVVYLTSFLFFLKYRDKRKKKWLFLCGCFTGLALIVRPDAPLFIIVIVLGILALFYRDYRDKKRALIVIMREAFIFLTPLLFFFAVYAYYNYARFGSFFELGYATKAQKVAETGGEGKGFRIRSFRFTLLGLLGMWIIPCRSMFFINPVLIFIFWALKDFWKKYKFECILIGITLILHIFLYSNRGPSGFPGSSAWGIRYMVPMTGFMVIIMGTFVNNITTLRKGKFYLRVFVMVFLVSVFFQFIGSSVSYQATQKYLEEQYNTPEDDMEARRKMNFDPRWNLITQNTKKLLSGFVDLMYLNYIKGNTTYYPKYLWISGPPAWVGVSLVLFLIMFSTSGYLLVSILVTPIGEIQNMEKSKRKKKKSG